MFIETLKNIAITLVTILIFISAVELIAPDDKMKKYIRFILGLILISVILNPIIKFISNGEKNISSSIQNYEAVFSKSKADLNKMEIQKESKNNEDARKKAFINNFNKNCDDILKKQFENMTFKSEVDCEVNFSDITLNVNKLKIGVGESKITKVKKVVIKNNEQSNEQDVNKEYTEIINFVSKELNIPKEKIEVYKLEE